ncbi:MAG: hypothetical protein ACYCX2_04665 [Christensenellales bacterium]
MQKKYSLQKKSHRLLSVLILSVMAAGVLLMSSCGRPQRIAANALPPAQAEVRNNKGSAGNAVPPARAERKNNQANTKSRQEHTIQIVPETLEEAQKTLSLTGYGARGALADTELTVADMLTYAIQDEYLAHGEYAAIIGKFGSSNPYANIIRAEETHISYVKDLFAAYGLEAPADASAEHVAVPGDLLAAAQTGVQAEKDNIAMYALFLTKDLPQSMEDVFTSLMRSSESHLAAFERQVDRLS